MSQVQNYDCTLESLPQEDTDMPHLILVSGPHDDDSDGEDEDSIDE